MFLLILENPQFASRISRYLQYVCDYHRGLDFLFSKKTLGFAHCDTRRDERVAKAFLFTPYHNAESIVLHQTEEKKRWEVEPSECELKQINIVCGRWWRERESLGVVERKVVEGVRYMHGRHSHTPYQITPRGPRGLRWQRCVRPSLSKKRKTSPGSVR